MKYSAKHHGVIEGLSNFFAFTAAGLSAYHAGKPVGQVSKPQTQGVDPTPQAPTAGESTPPPTYNRDYILENIRKSKEARQASNFGEYVKKEKEILRKLEEFPPTKRPSWRQSEIDIGKDYPDYEAQKSFLNGEEVPYRTKGSVRPEYYKSGHSIEVKNYNLETPSGRNNLVNNVSKQIIQRNANLPSGTFQTIVVDIRGQRVSHDILKSIKSKILNKSQTQVEIRFMK
ncbi:hypothetical protein [Streptococcus oricebi]|uniref:tRNA nuclease CdiA C-terminal domain-containing protein n=1 Tax=Streptococcus oricebi TaxID=1547447 RepID=A0ABS5B3H8_9STRE|nr:hypothetical protein [Streptococcus oricebi]MBP2623226.1 hypothetical protein [Streptococcus oricebi]